MANARRPVRLWLVAVTLFVAGFAGRLVLKQATPYEAYSYPSAIAIQFYFYAAGLFVLMVWRLRSENVGVRRILGRVGWLVAVLCGLVILSSIPK